MKRLYRLLTVCLSGALMLSCSGFLDEKVTTSLSETTVYSTAEALETQLFGVYQAMNQNRLWLGTHYEWLQPGSGLIIWKGSKTTDDYLDQLYFTKYSNTNECNANLYTQLYAGINRCNRLLDNLPGSPVDPGYKLEIEAETRLCRAIFYYWAVRQWGDVPLILSSPKSLDQVHNPRTVWYKVYASILDDLTFAEENMRDRIRQETVNPGKGRPFNMAATALKSSVYLTIGSLLSSPDDNFWDSSKDQQRIASGRDPRTPDFSSCGITSAKDAFQLAYDCTKTVMTSGAYSLVGNYFKLFTWSEQEDYSLPERILMVQITPTGGAVMSALRTLPQYPPYTSNYSNENRNWGRVRPDRFLINEFIRRTGGTKGTSDDTAELYIATTDPRFDASYLHNFTNLQNGARKCYPNAYWDSYNATYSNPYFRKYSDPTYDANNGRADCYMMRYAEIYLIRAEAAVQLSASVGDEYWNEALALVEDLHARARASYDIIKGETSPRNTEFPRWNAADFTTKEQLRDAIVWERFIEMSGECHEWFDTHRYGATWLRDNIALPKNDFSSIDVNAEYYETLYGKIRPHPETVAEIRKGLVCAFPADEMRQNTSMDISLDQNDFYWK